VYCKVTTTSKVVSAIFEKGRNNKAETWDEDVGFCRNSNDHDFSAAKEPQAAPERTALKRKQQIVKSDSVFLHLAQIIDANLKDEEGSQNFGPVLKNKGERGKGPAADRIHTFMNASNHLLFHGKATTVQTVSGWFEECKVSFYQNRPRSMNSPRIWLQKKINLFLNFVFSAFSNIQARFPGLLCSRSLTLSGLAFAPAHRNQHNHVLCFSCATKIFLLDFAHCCGSTYERRSVFRNSPARSEMLMRCALS